MLPRLETGERRTRTSARPRQSASRGTRSGAARSVASGYLSAQTTKRLVRTLSVGCYATKSYSLGIMPTIYPQVKMVFICCCSGRFCVNHAQILGWAGLGEALTLNSVPCMLSSSCMPDTYAFDTLLRSRSVADHQRVHTTYMSTSRASNKQLQTRDVQLEKY